MLYKAGILLLTTVFIFYLCGCSSPKSSPAPVAPEEIHDTVPEKDPEEKPEETDSRGKTYNPVTGEHAESLSQPIAIMIDNLSTARPQTGLASADVVYEAEAEGSITRFMAIFYGNNPGKAGPVRSARPYFLRLVKPWDCYFAHVGGSVQALADIPRLGIRDIDDLRGDRGFSLDGPTRTGHNTYLDIREALEKRKPLINPPGWSFISTETPAPDYTSISFSYDRTNIPGYRWDSKNQAYLRTINGKPHLDKSTGEQIAAHNIIIQYARHIYSGDKLGHIEIVLEGQGKAEFFLGGRYTAGSWHTTGGNHTVYRDLAGKPVEFAPGKTWIQVVRPEIKVELIK